MSKMNRFFHNSIRPGSIRVKIILTYLILITVFFVILNGIFSASIQNNAIEAAKKESSALLQNAANTVDAKFMVLDDLNYIFYTDSEFTTSLDSLLPLAQRTSYEQYEHQTKIMKTLSLFTRMNPSADSFSLYSMKGKSYFTTSGISSLVNNYEPCPFVELYEAYPDQKWIVSSDVDTIDKMPVLVNYHPIYNFGTNEKIGLFSMNINASTIENYLDSLRLKQTGFVFAVDGTGAPIALHDVQARDFLDALEASGGIQEGDFSRTLSMFDANYLISQFKSPYTGWSYYAAVPLPEILASTSSLNDISIVSYFAMVLAFVIALVIDSSFFYQPFIELFKAMKQVENGNMSVQIPIRRKDEIGYINQAFNHMIKSLDRQIQENYINQLLLQEAQLINVYSKIDEHFLYNTLDSIRWAAGSADPAVLSDMILNLSRFYRMSLSGGSDLISISEAVDMIESYLSLQQFRAQNQFRYEIVSDPEIGEIQILKYILQPLVENSVVHGLSKMDGNGRIEVRILPTKTQIKFEISDNGTGIPADKLSRIKKCIAEKYTSNKEYFALHNVNLLLKTFYGENACLHIDSCLGKGTTVTFDLPRAVGKEDCFES